MKKSLFTLFTLFILVSEAQARNFIYNPHTGRLDAVGVEVSSDLTVPCPSGQILKASGAGVWACGDDATGAGANITVKADDAQISNAVSILDLGLGLDGTEAPSGEINVSIDPVEVKANATTAGFIQPESMVSIDRLVAVSHDAVTLTGENYLTLSGQQITAGTVNDTNLTAEDFGDFTCDSGEDGCLVDANAVALTTDTTGNYVQSVATTSPLSGGAAGSEGATLTLSLTQNAGTDVTADLEEETHASEHQDGGADEIAVTAGMMNAGTGASSSTFWRGDNTWATPSGGSSTFNWRINPQTAKLPLVNPAAIDAGTPNWRLLFDDTTSERVSFDTVFAPYAGGAISMDIQYTAAAATGGVAFAVFVECVTPGDSLVIDGGSFGTINSTKQTVPGTAGHLAQVGNGLGDIDSCAQGDRIRIMVSRDVTSTDDTEVGDIAIREIRVYES